MPGARHPVGGLSGIELHQQIHAFGSSTPLTHITAHDEPETRKLALAAGGVAHCRKTAPGQDVVAKLESKDGLKANGKSLQTRPDGYNFMAYFKDYERAPFESMMYMRWFGDNLCCALQRLLQLESVSSPQ